jgi:hypothetical protein
MFQLNYAIRTTPVSTDAMQWILQAQSLLNEATEWSKDELSWALVDGAAVRDTQAFPFVNTMFPDLDEKMAFKLLEDGCSLRIPKASMVGTSEIQTLWEFHLIVAFLCTVSQKFPDLLLSLSDETCQLLPVGAIEIQRGKVRPYTNWLCSEHEFYVNMSGDEDCVVQRAFAQAKALMDNNCMVDMPAKKGALHQMRALGLDEDCCESTSVSEVATKFVRDILAVLL